VLPSKCLALRVAPVQPFPPFAQPGKVTLHDPVGYRGGYGVHVLERGMRLGVKKVGCASEQLSTGKVFRYSGRIRERLGGSLLSDVLAPSLREGEIPVELGTVVKVGSIGSFELTTFRQACTQLLVGNDVCDPPVELDTQKLSFIFRERGSQASAKYSDRSFGTKDNDLTGDHESVKVTGLDLKGLATAASGFQATAYVLENGKETRPQTRLVGLNQPFLIYADDISDQNLFPELAYGTGLPSGLAWPRVVGTRNGEAFWYSAALPRIARDRTLEGSCIPIPPSTLPAGPPNPKPQDPAAPNYPPQKPFPVPLVQDSYYELPFPKDFGPIKSGGLNIDDPQPWGRHGDSQPWALDLNAPYGTLALASRGGVVVNLFDNDKYNDAPSYADPENNDNRPASNDKIGNYIWVRHEDGSFAVYFHHRRKTAKVKLGDTIRRGQALANVGSTGLATGPHVDVEPFSYQGVINVGETNPGGTVGTNLRARYGAAVVPDLFPVPLLEVAEFNPCYIPRKGDHYYSTNSFPKGD
jgi:murein DD-endopeptidase MepM/ murein hydrolase activator NlpD